jgi:hypothetical protein
MTERYRCKPGTNIWHDNRRCSQWPLIDYWSHVTTPATGEHCRECSERHTKTGSAS